jgi:hypothetical protein
MLDNMALADVGRRLRHLAKTGGLFVTYPRRIQDQMSANGLSDVDLLNVLRTGTISEIAGLNNYLVVGRVDDGTGIELLITWDEIRDQKVNRPVARVRIDKINWPNGRSEKKKKLAKKGKVEIVRKLRAVR